MSMNHRAARLRSLAREDAWTTPDQVEVTRMEPPEQQVCKWHECRRPVEWVWTMAGGLMPLVDPFPVLATPTPRSVVVAVRYVHWRWCPHAPTFLRVMWGWTPMDDIREGGAWSPQ
jgi:hypothetical protein